MQLCPGFHEALLLFRQSSCDQIDRVDRIDRDLVLIVGVQMRSTVRSTRLRIHPNDDAEESGDLWHSDLSPGPSGALGEVPRRGCNETGFLLCTGTDMRRLVSSLAQKRSGQVRQWLAEPLSPWSQRKS